MMLLAIAALLCETVAAFGHFDDITEVDRFMVAPVNKFPASWFGGSSLPMDTASFNPVTGTADFTDAVSEDTIFVPIWRFKEYSDGSCMVDIWYYFGGLLDRAGLGAPQLPDSATVTAAEIWERYHKNVTTDLFTAFVDFSVLLEIVKGGMCTIMEEGDVKKYVLDRVPFTLRGYAASNFNHGRFLYLDEWGEFVDTVSAIQVRNQTFDETNVASPYQTDLVTPVYLTLQLTSGRYITDHYSTWFYSGNGTYGGNGAAMGLAGQEELDASLEPMYADGTPY